MRDVCYVMYNAKTKQKQLFIYFFGCFCLLLREETSIPGGLGAYVILIPTKKTQQKAPHFELASLLEKTPHTGDTNTANTAFIHCRQVWSDSVHQ